MSSPPRQPWLHELNVCVWGNVTAMSSRSGDMHPGSASGLYVDDRRAISELAVLVGGEAPSAVVDASYGSRGEFVGSARNLGSVTPDPVVEVRRSRTLVTAGMVETIDVVSRADRCLTTVLEVRLGSDGAPIGSIKAGCFDAPPLPPTLGESEARFSSEDHTYAVTFEPMPERLAVVDGVVVASFDLTLEPQQDVHLRLSVAAIRLSDTAFDADPGGDQLGWEDVHVSGVDPRLEPTVTRSLEDLRALSLNDPHDRGDVFSGAGTPWYLTLFGRDSIWAARLTLPIGTTLARGTLRTLARRQGRRHDAVSAEAPGKIPHEVRRTTHADATNGLSLPSVYYGTVDATALWIMLLHDAWRWGLADADVVPLLDNLVAAVGWLVTDAVPDGDGMLKYIDESGGGLANQGWKDSGDAVRFHDGSIAAAPIALVEAQAYAACALECAATMYTAFGVGGAEKAQERAAALHSVIRDRFWVTGRGAPYLGLAVDGAGRLTDGLASNMGHVLGTGVLTSEEAGAVAGHLISDAMLDRFGVRTLSSDNGGFNPIGYHTGSIWTHDTAIIARGLADEGRTHEAVTVARTLLASAEAFGYRWPELYCGATALGQPAPYPAACRPQAWSAASSVALLSIALGLTPDAQGRTLHVTPPRPPAFGAMRVEGLRFCGGRIDLELDAHGEVTVLRAPSDVTVLVH